MCVNLEATPSRRNSSDLDNLQTFQPILVSSVKTQITTSAWSPVRSCTDLLGRLLSYDRIGQVGHRISQCVSGLKSLWHSSRTYLRELKQEVCNLCWRMGMLRKRRLYRTGIVLLDLWEWNNLSPARRDIVLRDRILRIQKLLTRFPMATLADCQIAVESGRARRFWVEAPGIAPCDSRTYKLDTSPNSRKWGRR